jgi:phosphoglycerate kinase
MLSKAIADSAAFPLPVVATRWRPSTSTVSSESISYISTGGGAFLEFVEGKVLPAVDMATGRRRRIELIDDTGEPRIREPGSRAT